MGLVELVTNGFPTATAIKPVTIAGTGTGEWGMSR